MWQCSHCMSNHFLLWMQWSFWAESNVQQAQDWSIESLSSLAAKPEDFSLARFPGCFFQPLARAFLSCRVHMFFPLWHHETAALKRETVISEAWHLWRWPSVWLKKALTWIHLISLQFQTVKNLFSELSPAARKGPRSAEVTTETSCPVRKWAWPNGPALTDTSSRPREPEWCETLVIPATYHPCYAPSCGRPDLCRGLVAAAIL